MTEPLINKKATFSFEILETFEAGMVLSGPEVKSIRAGQVSFAGSHVSLNQNQPILLGLNITPYEYARDRQINPKRPRLLLLHQKEINRLQGIAHEKKLTIIPLKIYFKNKRAKVELGVARGKKKHDRRETLKRKTAERDMAIALKERL